MPHGTFANGVAPLPNSDGVVVTNFFDPTKSDPFSQIFSDTPSGNLMRWLERRPRVCDGRAQRRHRHS